MKLEQQVVSLELAKKLKELGVKQDSLFYWWGTFNYRPYPQRVNVRHVSNFLVEQKDEVVESEE